MKKNFLRTYTILMKFWMRVYLYSCSASFVPVKFNPDLPGTYSKIIYFLFWQYFLLQENTNVFAFIRNFFYIFMTEISSRLFWLYSGTRCTLLKNPHITLWFFAKWHFFPNDLIYFFFLELLHCYLDTLYMTLLVPIIF